MSTENLAGALLTLRFPVRMQLCLPVADAPSFHASTLLWVRILPYIRIADQHSSVLLRSPLSVLEMSANWQLIF